VISLTSPPQTRSAAPASRTVDTLLTRLFLRRFLENDLLSPDADRAQLVALLGATCFCSTLFVSVVRSSFRYVMGMLTPAQVAVASLDDKSFYIGLSMIVSALVAASQWDALAIEPRDAAILEPMPVTVSTIRRAKLRAIALLGASAALLLNLAPTLIFPLLLVVKQQVTLLGALSILATHAVVTISAAIFGYVGIVALRELMWSLLGPRLFTRASPLLQGLLVVALGSALLLLPASSARVESRALAATMPTPPTWFLGAYETLVGHVVIDAPRGPLAPRLAIADRLAERRYQARRGQFAALAPLAVIALVTVCGLAAAGHLWNSRRFPQLAPPSPSETYRRSRLAGYVRRLVVGRDPYTAVGFDFTIAVLRRSRAHRLLLACAVAFAVAIIVVALSGLDPQSAVVDGRASARLLVAQPLLYGALLVGFRQAIRMPAALSANWTFQLAWRGRGERYVTGVRRAAIVALVCPALAVVFPLVAAVLDPLTAAAHAALGVVGALLMLEALLMTYDNIPFTCSLVPNETLKALAPIYFFAFVLGAFAFARTESAALISLPATATLIAQLATAIVVLKLVRRWRGYAARVEFDAVPERTQQLGLQA
jgi:hypothetical protein